MARRSTRRASDRAASAASGRCTPRESNPSCALTSVSPGRRAHPWPAVSAVVVGSGQDASGVRNQDTDLPGGRRIRTNTGGGAGMALATRDYDGAGRCRRGGGHVASAAPDDVQTRAGRAYCLLQLLQGGVRAPCAGLGAYRPGQLCELKRGTGGWLAPFHARPLGSFGMSGRVGRASRRDARGSHTSDPRKLDLCSRA
jgi:hypothetical protein